MRCITIAIALVLTMALVENSSQAIAQSSPIGSIRTYGTWVVDGQTLTDNSTPANDNALVSIAPNTSAAARRTARVVIIYSVIGQDPYVCTGSDPCSGGFRIHGRSKPDPFLSRILGYIHPQAEPDLAIARGTTQHLDDGIVKRDGQSLDMGPLVAALPRGTYRAIVTRPPGSMPAIIINQLIDTNAATLTLATSGVTDGLYVLVLLDPSTLQPATTAAYIAVAAEPGYTARRATFDQAVAATRAWTQTPANNAAATTLVHDLVIAVADPAWQP